MCHATGMDSPSMAQPCLSQTSCLRIAGNLAEYEKIYISYASRSEKSLRLYAKFIKENVRKTWGAKIILNPMRKDFQMGMEGSLAGCSRFRCKQRRGT